ESEARDAREHGSARCEMEKISAGEVHPSPPRLVIRGGRGRVSLFLFPRLRKGDVAPLHIPMSCCCASTCQELEQERTCAAALRLLPAPLLTHLGPEGLLFVATHTH